MVLGTAGPAIAGFDSRRPKTPVQGAGPSSRNISPAQSAHLWPGGVIPCVMDEGFTEAATRAMQVAIDEWNSRTVITLVERTTEPDSVLFVPEPSSPFRPLCSAQLGRVGGKQRIWLLRPEGCSVRAAIHEIEHAMGLKHEHQRVDRDHCVTVSEARLNGPLRYACASETPAGGPCDFASVMHYGRIGSIPPGIPVTSDRLSPRDIDGVARMHGKPPELTTISTNPPGLAVIVDGQRVVTPAQFDWSPGSQHILAAPSSQILGPNRFLFGRWHDGGSSRRTVTAGPGSTWIEANYIVQQGTQGVRHSSGSRKRLRLSSSGRRLLHPAGTRRDRGQPPTGRIPRVCAMGLPAPVVRIRGGRESHQGSLGQALEFLGRFRRKLQRGPSFPDRVERAGDVGPGQWRMDDTSLVFSGVSLCGRCHGPGARDRYQRLSPLGSACGTASTIGAMAETWAMHSMHCRLAGSSVSISAASTGFARPRGADGTTGWRSRPLRRPRTACTPLARKSR